MAYLSHWLPVGMRVKRYLILVVFGLVLICLGGAYFLRALYSVDVRFPAWVGVLTLQFLSRPLRGLLFVLLGGGSIALGFSRLCGSLITPLLPYRGARVIDIMYDQRRLRRGPKVVAIGGGTGLSVLLGGLKAYTSNLSGVVTVADDGGSSGRLRRQMGILPPGDFRQCLSALAEAEPLMTKLLHFRFGQGSGLEGHNLGNLMMAAMSEISGSFGLGLREMGRVLAVKGRILPSTLADITLVAELSDQTFVLGESSMHEDHASTQALAKDRPPIARVFIKPAYAPGYPEAVQAILDADLIVIGPGSLYTSILPNLLIDDILEALCASPAYKVFVCNVATEPGETDGYDVNDFLVALQRHVGRCGIDAVLVNTGLDASRPSYWNSQVVRAVQALPASVCVIAADVVDDHNAVLHDGAKLARALMQALAAHGRQGLRLSSKRAAW